MLDNLELERLNKAWPAVVIMWAAMLFCPAVYVGIPHFTEIMQVKNQIEITFSPNFTLATLKAILFGVSLLTLLAAYLVRKSMLKRGAPATPKHRRNHPALGKYMTATLIALFLVESIGIYGVVLFLLNKDWSSLHLLNIIAAAAIFHFRPRKQELLDLAIAMTRQPATQYE